MSAPAAVTLRRQGAPDLLVAYADAVAALPIGPDARRIRRNAAERLLAVHPQLAAWMRRPTPARLADLKRTGAWPFLSWCFAEGHLRPTWICCSPRLPVTFTGSGRPGIPATCSRSPKWRSGSGGARTGPGMSPAAGSP